MVAVTDHFETDVESSSVEVTCLAGTELQRLEIPALETFLPIKVSIFLWFLRSEM
jgi:hypothetical protein